MPLLKRRLGLAAFACYDESCLSRSATDIIHTIDRVATPWAPPPTGKAFVRKWKCGPDLSNRVAPHSPANGFRQFVGPIEAGRRRRTHLTSPPPPGFTGQCLVWDREFWPTLEGAEKKSKIFSSFLFSFHSSDSKGLKFRPIQKERKKKRKEEKEKPLPIRQTLSPRAVWG